MKTPDEIKKDIIDCLEEAIEVGNTGDAHDLLAFSDKAYVCIVTARAYIHDLETDKSRLNDTIRSLTELLNAAHEETEKVKRERDAAVASISEYRFCGDCKHIDVSKADEPCRTCLNDETDSKGEWEWRGVCPENTEVD
jgi:hypothetical protein